MNAGSGVAAPVGSIDVALAHAARLLERDPRLAAEQASEILRTFPGEPNATLILGIAERASGNRDGALAALAPLVVKQPRWAAARYELGVTLSELGHGEAAVAELKQAVELNPDFPDAWRTLADHLTAMGDEAAADAARARFLKVSTRDPRLMAAAAALCENRIPEAEALLRRHLTERPTDIAAIRMFAEVAARLERYADAENLLARCLELAPGFSGARRNYATVLHRQYKDAAALEQVERLLTVDRADPTYRNLKAAILGALGRYDEAIELYAGMLAALPGTGKGVAQLWPCAEDRGPPGRTIGAYRRCLVLLRGAARPIGVWPTSRPSASRRRTGGDARAACARERWSAEERLHLHFALGKALEDAGEYEESFDHYAEGNACAARAPLRRRRDHGARAALAATLTRRSSSPSARLRQRRRPIRSSSSACRARARRCSSRSSPAIRGSKARWSCPTSGDRARARRRASRRSASRIPACSPLSTPSELPRARRATISTQTRDPAQDRARRSSSTRCRTISCTSG